MLLQQLQLVFLYLHETCNSDNTLLYTFLASNKYILEKLNYLIGEF